jgi:hypothetical protein
VKFCKFAVGDFDHVQVCKVGFPAGDRRQHASRVRSPDS